MILKNYGAKCINLRHMHPTPKWMSWQHGPLVIISPLTVQSCFSVVWHLVRHAAMFANVKWRKSIKHTLRNRGDIMRRAQAFSHACVSVSGRDELLLYPIPQESPANQREDTRHEKGKCDFPEEKEASCPRLNVSVYTGIVFLYGIGNVQLLTHANSLCLIVYRHSSVPMAAWVNVCWRPGILKLYIQRSKSDLYTRSKVRNDWW